jgi:uncharacterized protein
LLLFAASFVGSAHCVGMCGPYIALCGAHLTPPDSPPAGRILLRLLFNAGRIATYTAIGVLAGAFGQVAQALAGRSGLQGIVALAAGVTSVLFGLALLGWIGDPARAALHSGLGALLREGSRGAFRRPPYPAALLLGAVQGAFPCALVYGAAAAAAAAGSPGRGALTMLVFGLGTLPAVFALTTFSARLTGRLHAWRGAGLLVAAVGVLLILRGLAAFSLIPATAFW